LSDPDSRYDADILSVDADGFPVVEKWSVDIDEGAGSVGHRVVIQMVQMTVVLQFWSGPIHLSVEVRTAQEFVLYFARSLARLFVACQKFLVDVEVDPDVMGDAFLLDADVGRSVIAFIFTSFTAFEAEIFKVVDVACVNEFGRFVS